MIDYLSISRQIASCNFTYSLYHVSTRSNCTWVRHQAPESRQQNYGWSGWDIYSTSAAQL